MLVFFNLMLCLNSVYLGIIMEIYVFLNTEGNAS